MSAINPRTEPVVSGDPASRSAEPAEADLTERLSLPLSTSSPAPATEPFPNPWPPINARLPAGHREPSTTPLRPAAANRRNIRRRGLQGEDSRNRWLVSYADFVTLLLGFFVVMYAMSSINEEKYKEMSKSFAGIFENSTLTTEPIQVGEPQTAASTDLVDTVESPGYEQAEKGDTMVRTSREYVESMLGGFAENEGLNVAVNDPWLEISLDSDVSFDSGSAGLKPGALAFLKEIARWLNTFDHPIIIEGYTDNVPVSAGRFSSNWQLSSARASAVAEYLTTAGIDAERISAIGYGENHPLVTNATPEGRAKNRRVVLVVAHNANLPRNLNTAPETSAFAFVRHADDKELPVSQRRTERGGLLFSNE